MIVFDPEDGTGRSTANSYVTVAESDDIAVLNIHDSDTWLTLGVTSKERLLMYASRVLDSRTTWVGCKTLSTQGLEWPRIGVLDRYQNTVSSTSVPYAVRWAAVEFAKASQTVNKLSSSRPDSAISELKIDSITVKFADPALFSMDQFRTPDIVREILRGFGYVRGGTSKVTFGKVYRK